MNMIEVNQEEAETILFALAMRSRQKGLPPQLQTVARELGVRLNNSFESAFGWTKHDRMKDYRSRIKAVSIKTFDLPPVDC